METHRVDIDHACLKCQKMIAAGLILIFILPTIVVIGYLANRDRLFEIARSLQNNETFSSFSSLSPREAFPIAPGEDRLDWAHFWEAIAALVAYIETVKPDWIVGVHPGGRLLSVLAAERAGIPKNRCLYVRMTTTKKIMFEPQRYRSNSPIEGTMLIIDDISRSGRTLQTLKKYLMQKNYPKPCASSNEEQIIKLRSVKFAALLVVSEPDDPANRFRPNLACYRTENRFFALPWSEYAARVDAAFAMRKQQLDYDENIIRDYETMASDYDYALKLANEYLSTS